MSEPLKVEYLKRLLSYDLENRDDWKIRVLIDKPSMGPRSSAPVKSIHFGFDWENGLLLISPEISLVPKSKDESIFDMARDLLMYIATKNSKRESYEIRTARKILEKVGYTSDDFQKYRSYFHRDDK